MQRIEKVKYEIPYKTPIQLPKELEGVISFETFLYLTTESNELLSENSFIIFVGVIIILIAAPLIFMFASISLFIIFSVICCILLYIIYIIQITQLTNKMSKLNSTLKNGTQLLRETISEGDATKIIFSIEYYPVIPNNSHPINDTDNNNNNSNNNNINNNSNNNNNNSNNSNNSNNNNNNNNNNNSNNNNTLQHIQYQPSSNTSDIRDHGNDRSGNYFELKMSNFDSDSDLEIEISPFASDNKNNNDHDNNDSDYNNNAILF